MMIICGNNGKVTVKSKFPCAVCRKDVGSSSILCRFCRCSVHKRCSGIRGKLKEDSKDECQICLYRQLDIAEDCPDMEKLLEQFLHMKKSFVFLMAQ